MKIMTLLASDPNNSKIVEKTHIFWDDMFSHDYKKKRLNVSGNEVVLTYSENVLYIITDSNVNVLINIKAAPIIGLRIFTKGKFILKGAMNLNLGLIAHASYITVDGAIRSPGFIALSTANNPDGEIHIKQKIMTNKIGMITKVVENNSHIITDQILVMCKEYTNGHFGLLDAGSPVLFEKNLVHNSHSALFDFCDALTSNADSKSLLNTVRFISTESFTNKSRVKLTNIELQVFNKLTHAPQSVTTYSNVRIFNSGDSYIAESAVVNSNNSYLETKKFLDIDGQLIGSITSVSDSLNVNGLIEGEQLNVHVNKNFICYGNINAETISVTSNHVFVRPAKSNTNNINDFLTKGKIFASKSLSINALSTSLIGGGCLHSPKLNLRVGIYINFLGIIRSYNFNEKTLLTTGGCLDLPCMPEGMDELLDLEKILRIFNRILGIPFPAIQTLFTFGILAKEATIQTVKAAKHVYKEPSNFANDVKKTSRTAADSTYNAAKNVATFAADTFNDPVKQTKNVSASATKAINQINEAWSNTKALELVNYLLAAHDLLIIADMIISKGTNSIIFANGVKKHIKKPNIALTMLQDSFLKTMKEVGSAFTDPNIGKNIMAELKIMQDKTALKLNSQMQNTLNFAKTAVTNPNAAIDMVSQSASAVINTIDPLKAINKANKKLQDKAEDLMKAGNDLLYGSEVIDTSFVENSPATEAEKLQIEPVNEPEQTSAIGSSLDAPEQKVALDEGDPGEQITEIESVVDNKTEVVPLIAKASDNPAPNAIVDLLMMIGPSVNKYSLINADFGLTISGTVIEENLLSSNDGIILALGSSCHTVFGYRNGGGIYSYYRTEVVGDRYNTGDVHANNYSLESDNNIENGNFDVSKKLVFNIKNDFFMGNGAKFSIPENTYGTVKGIFSSAGNLNISGGKFDIGHYLLPEGAKHNINPDTNFNAKLANVYGSLNQNQAKVHIDEAIIHKDAHFGNKNSLHSGESLTFEPGAKIELVNDFIDVKKLHDKGAKVYTDNHITRADKLIREGDWTYKGVLHDNVSHIKSTQTSNLRQAENAKGIYSLKAITEELEGKEKHTHLIAEIKDMSGEDTTAYALGTVKYAGIDVTDNVDLTTGTTDNIIYAGSRANGARVQIQTEGKVVLPTEFKRALDLKFESYEDAEIFVKAIYSTYNLSPPPDIKIRGWKKYLKHVSAAFATVSAACANAPGNPITFAIGAACAAGAYGTDQARRHYDRKLSREIERRELESLRNKQQQENTILSLQERNVLAKLEAMEHQEAISNIMVKAAGGNLPQDNINAISDHKLSLMQQAYARRQDINAEFKKAATDIAYSYARHRDLLSKTGGPVIGCGAAISIGSSGVSTFATFTGGNRGNVATGKLQLTSYEFSKNRAPAPSYHPKFPRVLPTITEIENDEENDDNVDEDKKTAKASTNFNNVVIKSPKEESGIPNSKPQSKVSFEAKAKLNSTIEEAVPDKKLSQKLKDFWKDLDEGMQDTEYYDRPSLKKEDIEPLTRVAKVVLEHKTYIPTPNPLKYIDELIRSTAEFDRIFNAEVIDNNYQCDMNSLLDFHQNKRDSIVSEFLAVKNHFSTYWQGFDADSLQGTDYFERPGLGKYEIKALAGAAVGVARYGVVIPFEFLTHMTATAEEFDNVYNPERLTDSYEYDRKVFLYKTQDKHDSLMQSLSHIKHVATHIPESILIGSYALGKMTFEMASTPESGAFEAGVQLGKVAVNARYVLSTAHVSGKFIAKTHPFEYRAPIIYSKREQRLKPRTFMRPKWIYFEPTMQLPGWKENDFLSAYDFKTPVKLTWEQRDIVAYYMYYRFQQLKRLNELDLDIFVKTAKEKRLIKNAISQIKDHMHAGDLSAWLKENDGAVIIGKHQIPAQHSTEYKLAKSSMENLEWIKESIHKPRPEAQRLLIHQAKTILKETWDEYNKMGESEKIPRSKRVKLRSIIEN